MPKRLSLGSKKSQSLIRPPKSKSMRSGLVILPPGELIKAHNTKQNEEILIGLEGSGKVRFPDKDLPSFSIGAKRGVYIPPMTNHEVINIGTAPLRYVYIVAPSFIS